MKFDTNDLKAVLESETPVDASLFVAQVYHIARGVDALERIATHLENGQIATLEGASIVSALREIKREINQ